MEHWRNYFSQKIVEMQKSNIMKYCLHSSSCSLSLSLSKALSTLFCFLKGLLQSSPPEHAQNNVQGLLRPTHPHLPPLQAWMDSQPHLIICRTKSGAASTPCGRGRGSAVCLCHLFQTQTPWDPCQEDRCRGQRTSGLVGDELSKH